MACRVWSKQAHLKPCPPLNAGWLKLQSGQTDHHVTSALRNWILTNCGLLAILYAGLLARLPLLTNAAAAIVWFVLVVYAVLYYSAIQKTYTDPAPRWLGLSIDAAALIGLGLSELYITAGAYFASMILLALVYRRSKENGGANRRQSLGAAGVSSMNPEREELVSRLALATANQLTKQGLHRRPILHTQDIALLGYTRGLTDIVAQSLFPEDSGAPLLLFVALHAHLLGGTKNPVHLVQETEDYTRFGNPQFIIAAQAGATDAEAFLKNRALEGLRTTISKLESLI